MTRSRRVVVLLAVLAAAPLIALGAGVSVQASAGVADSTGFYPSSTSWTSPSVGWVFGWSSCRSGLCPGLLHTTDDGATWSKGTTPDIQPSDVGFQTRVFFAERHGHSIGLITNSRDLFVTYDGARTWRPMHLPHAELIGGIGADARSVYVVGHEQDGSQVSTQAFSSPIQRPRWHAVPGVTATSPGGIYSTMSVVNGSGRAVQISTSTYGGVVELWTALNGHRFESARPCNPLSVMYPGMGAGHQQFALCSFDPGHGNMYKELRTGSADDQFTTVVGAPPVDGITSGFAVSNDSTIAVGATKNSFGLVHESFDGGRTWETTLAAPETGPVRDLSFQDPQHGVLVAGTSEIGWSVLYRTTDGGHTWTALEL
jgi:hypothetical protein